MLQIDLLWADYAYFDPNEDEYDSLRKASLDMYRKEIDSKVSERTFQRDKKLVLEAMEKALGFED